MPRLDRERIKQAITFDQLFVRQYAALHFSEAYSRDPDVLPRVIEAFEQYGWQHAFELRAPFTELAHTDETFRWCLKSLAEVGADKKRVDDAYWLARMISNADIAFLQKHYDSLAQTPGWEPELWQAVEERLAFSEQDTQTLWHQLEALTNRDKNQRCVTDIERPRAYRLIEAIGRDPACADHALEWIAHEWEDAYQSLMEIWCIRLAGEMRLEAAVPHLERKLHFDEDWPREECIWALPKIGTDAVADAIADGFHDGPWHYRLFAGGALEALRGEHATRCCLDLAEQEPDLELKANLLRGALLNFETDAIEPSVEVAQQGVREHLTPLLAVSLLAEVDFPDRDRWLGEELERHKRVKRGPLGRSNVAVPPAVGPPIDKSPPAAAPAESTRPGRKHLPGRNDPCHCGSGKKYKKCCLPNER